MRESWHKGKMNFQKGIQGILRLHAFIQVVTCAIVRTTFSSASGRAHAKYWFHTYKKKYSIILINLVKKQLFLSQHTFFLQLRSFVLTICPKI